MPQFTMHNVSIVFARFFFGGILKKRAVATALCLLTLTSSAYADWLTTVEDDLFSENKNAVMIGMVNQSSSIYVTCSGPENVELAYIEAMSEGGSFSEPIVAGEIVFKSDNGARFVSETSVYTHNAKFAGFSYDDKATVIDAIKSFGDADSKVAIGLNLIISETPSTATASARGSSKAVKQFIEACGLAEQ